MNSHDETPRILLTRTSHIGDCVLTLPMLCALRDRFPGAFIAWAVEQPSDQFLRHHPALDQVIPLRRGWLKRPTEILQLRRTLRALEFDVALDSQSRTRSAISAWLSGARRRIGWQAPEGKDVSLLVNRERYVSQSPHLVDRQLDLLKALGIESPRVRFDFPLQLEAQRTMDTFLRERDLQESFIAMNPGAGWESRRWPTDRYAHIARWLHESHGLFSVVTWAGAEEQAMAEQIVQSADGAAVAAPCTSLHELAALLRRATFYFGSDTGPMHFAAAVGTRCVALFGPTRPECSGPYGAGHVAVQAYYQQGGGMARRNAGNDAMLAIDVAMAQQGCHRLLRQVA
jgi:lipopolysaccharide heptosyltransferase I